MKSKYKKIILIILGIGIVLTTIVLSFALILKPPPTEKPNTPQYTTYYENINITDAKELIETNSNLTIVDCRGNCLECILKSGEYLPRAMFSENPEDLYNSNYDILVYSDIGLKSINFCKQLVNHVYGKIYNLEGGYVAWRKKQ